MILCSEAFVDHKNPSPGFRTLISPDVKALNCVIDFCMCLSHCGLLNLCNKKISLPFASINNIRSMIYVDNLIDLITCCIDHPKAAGEVFLISDEQNISTTELIKKIRKFMNKPERLFPLPLFIFKLLGYLLRKSPEINRLLGSLIVDTSHTRKVLGWKPAVNIEEGLKKTVNWYLKNL